LTKGIDTTYDFCHNQYQEKGEGMSLVSNSPAPATPLFAMKECSMNTDISCEFSRKNEN
jgi:hypothetical protein